MRSPGNRKVNAILRRNKLAAGYDPDDMDSERAYPVVRGGAAFTS
jgi:hypothetical protein